MSGRVNATPKIAELHESDNVGGMPVQGPAYGQPLWSKRDLQLSPVITRNIGTSNVGAVRHNVEYDLMGRRSDLGAGLR